MMLPACTTFATIAPLPLLAWVPFKEPATWLQPWWYLLLIPLALGISLIYKALRLADLSRLPQQTLLMTVQIILALVGLAIALALFIQLIIPLLPVE